MEKISKQTPNGATHHQDVKLKRVTRILLPLCVMTAALGAVLSGGVQAQSKTVPVFTNGQAQVVAGFNDSTKWIRQEIWVETEFDSDGDGKRDRVHADVTRPLQTDTEGLKVAVVYESSPYYAGTASGTSYYWNVNQELGAIPSPRSHPSPIAFDTNRPVISSSLVSTWVPRGFAVVHSEAPGTGLSGGCPTLGTGPEELAPKAVVDWLNGRAKAYTTKTGNMEVVASWATGKVGMTGVSYNGTLSLAAAVTGVAGLEAIIPIAPNTSSYHYYRSNGLVRSPGGWLGEDVDVLYDYINSGDPLNRSYCDRTYRDNILAANADRKGGDYNNFWAERDLLNKIANVKAATLIAHGQQDFNVVPEHSIRIYEALKAAGKPAQLYLHMGGHGGSPTMEMMNKWFSHYLYGVVNNVENDPRSMIVREGASTPTAYANYPNPSASYVKLNPATGGNSRGSLSLTPVAASTIEKLTDDVQYSGATLAAASSSNNRLLYATPVLAKTLHLSGTPRVTMRLASSKAAANLSVWLVTLPFDSTATGSAGINGVISRGWADPQNYKSLTAGGNYNSKLPGEALVPGNFYSFTFDMQPHDRQIPAGKQLAVMVMSSDRDFTLRPAAGTQLTVDLAGTSISLPIVGGQTAYLDAFAQTPDTVLTNCTPMSLASLAANNWANYKLPLIASASSIVFTTSTSSGDADLYVKKSQRPTSSVSDCKSTGPTGTETCTLNAPTAGDFYLSVLAYNALTNLTVKACAQ